MYSLLNYEVDLWFATLLFWPYSLNFTSLALYVSARRGLWLGSNGCLRG
nr:MAG TPA_asm: hypothetical protein [Caudoviricetes sp.]